MIINSFHTYFNSGLSGKTVVMIIQDSRVQGAEEGPRDEWEKHTQRWGEKYGKLSVRSKQRLCGEVKD
jgi:hypothetical protein